MLGGGVGVVDVLDCMDGVVDVLGEFLGEEFFWVEEG